MADNKDDSMAMVAIVAVVAIIAIVMMFMNTQNGKEINQKALTYSNEDNTVGDLRASNSGKRCCFDGGDYGSCNADCLEGGGTCKDKC